jgi:hypothetical protein
MGSVRGLDQRPHVAAGLSDLDVHVAVLRQLAWWDDHASMQSSRTCRRISGHLSLTHCAPLFASLKADWHPATLASILALRLRLRIPEALGERVMMADQK